MKTIVKLLAVLALALGTLGIFAPAALAAPAPDNDEFPGARPANFGLSYTLDTTGATTDSDDDQLNFCGFAATDASVWYAFTTDTDREVFIDTSGSDYSAGISVGVGSQGNLRANACGPGAVFFFANPGTTYYVLVFDDQSDGGGNGGNLSISFNEPPPPPTVEFTVNPDGKFTGGTGIAVVSGTYTCTNGNFNIFGEARQNVGRFTIVGSFSVFDSGTCDGASHSWSADVFPQNGKFAGGQIMTRSFASSCNQQFLCGDAFVEQQVKLKGGGPKK